MPNFFNSTKFFSCLDLKESQELFKTTQMVRCVSDCRDLCPSAWVSQNQRTYHQQDVIQQSTACGTPALVSSEA